MRSALPIKVRLIPGLDEHVPVDFFELLFNSVSKVILPIAGNTFAVMRGHIFRTACAPGPRFERVFSDDFAQFFRRDIDLTMRDDLLKATLLIDKQILISHRQCIFVGEPR